MVADLLTKSVARAMFVELMRLLSEYSRLASHVPHLCSPSVRQEGLFRC